MRASCLLLVAMFATVGCGTGFEVARLSDSPEARVGAARIQVTEIQISDDLAGTGLGHESEIVTELAIANEGTAAFELKPGALSLRLALDPRAPEKTRAFASAWAGEGSFASQSGDGGYHLSYRPILVPPGTTRRAWLVFRAYAFAGSEIPRRVSLVIQETPQRHTELPLADPGRGDSQWEVPPVPSTWMAGVQNHTFFGQHLQGSAMALAISRMAIAGKLTWDVGFVSRLLHQVSGSLQTPTSAFSGLGVNAHVALPVWSRGSVSHPQQLSIFGGGELGLLVAVMRDLRGGETPPTYGVVAGELGFELGFGSIRRAPTPFPLSSRGRSLPRVVTRIGYTHWRVGGGGVDGYTAGLRLAW